VADENDDIQVNEPEDSGQGQGVGEGGTVNNPPGFIPQEPPVATQTPPPADPAPAETPPAEPERPRQPTDPVTIRCTKYVPGPGEDTPKSVLFKLHGVSRYIPIGGVMQGVVPRSEAEKFLVRVKRYWTAEPTLEIVEPKYS